MSRKSTWQTRLVELQSADQGDTDTIRKAADYWVEIGPSWQSDEIEAMRDCCRLILGDYCRRLGLDTSYRELVRGRWSQGWHGPMTKDPDYEETREPLKWSGHDVRTGAGRRRNIASRIIASLAAPKSPPDQYTVSRECAQKNLTGIARKIVELLCNDGGTLPLAKVAEYVSFSAGNTASHTTAR